VEEERHLAGEKEDGAALQLVRGDHPGCPNAQERETPRPLLLFEAELPRCLSGDEVDLRPAEMEIGERAVARLPGLGEAGDEARERNPPPRSEGRQQNALSHPPRVRMRQDGQRGDSRLRNGDLPGRYDLGRGVQLPLLIGAGSRHGCNEV
jgi:hypothetical protein